MNNVLMVGPARSVHGGISEVVNNLYDAGLDKVVNLKYIGSMEEGSKARKLFVAARAYFLFLLKLKWADIVHINMASDASLIRKSLFVRTAYRMHKKIVLHQHGGDLDAYYNKSNSKRKDYIRSVFDMADRILVLSPPYKEFLATITDENKISVFPNSIKICDAAVGKRPHDILFLGRICESKGMTELISAMDIVHEKIPGATLYVGGIYEDEKYREAILERPYIRFLGWVNGDTKEKYLGQCSVFVLPTHFEGQSVSILEAMAHSCAVVASDVGGIPMMIENGVNGILVEPKNAELLAQTLIDVLMNVELMGELGDAAHLTVCQGYNIENTIKALKNIYDELSEQYSDDKKTDASASDDEDADITLL